jgi:hypothetical protein
LTQFASKADQTITWDAVRPVLEVLLFGKVCPLRARAVSGGGTYPTIRTGYISSDRGTGLAIYKLVGTVLTQLGATLTVADAALRKFRASMIGTTVMFEHSDDVGTTWITAFNVKDSSITAAGLVHWVTGFDPTAQNASYIDNVMYA